jgi:hypothetical protein
MSFGILIFLTPQKMSEPGVIKRRREGKPTLFQDGMKDAPTPLTVNNMKSHPLLGDGMSLNKHTNKACISRLYP